jgi:hypothetical protein
MPFLFSEKAPVAPATIISTQEALISCLREELSLERRMITQYADLDSRDELVNILYSRVQVAETELEEACVIEKELHELIRGLRRHLKKLERLVGRIKVDEDMPRLLLLTKARDELLEQVARLQRANSNMREEWNEWNKEKYGLSNKPQTQARGKGNGTLTEHNLEQMRLPQKEVHAQCECTEIASELRVLRKENAKLKAVVTVLEEENGKSEGFDALKSWSQELENQRNDVLAAKQAVKEEGEQVRLYSHSHITMLTCPCLDFGRTSFA